jgi:uncharacterized membrane protein YgcG
MKMNKTNKQKNLLYAALMLLCFFTACKKNELPPDDQPVQERFFSLATITDSIVKDFAIEIKKENGEAGFLSYFIANNGYPVWNAAEVTTGEKGAMAMIPFALENTQEANGFLIARKNALGKYSFSLFRKNLLPAYTPANNREKLNSPQLQTVFDHFNREVFALDKRNPASKFQLPLQLQQQYPDKWNAKQWQGRTKNTAPGSNTGHHSPNTPGQQTCIEVEEEIEWWWNPDGDACNCNGDEYYLYSTYETTTVCFGGGDNNSSGSGSNGSGSGAGTGNGGTGGGSGSGSLDPQYIWDPSCQCTTLNPWWTGGGGIITPPYQMTQHEKDVFKQLEEEDAAADSIFVTKDCQGTLRTGNIQWNGTLQHWLIMIDYISTNPVYGEKEYAIPGSSPAGNRGYADLVDKFNNHIYEIKPDNPAGLTAGQIEVNRYVTLAKTHCPIRPGSFPPVWAPGTNYPTRLLSSGNPSMYLQARLAAPGVIVYDWIAKSNNPVPAPVVVPASALDKLKNLIDKLQQNLSRIEETIAEYMKDHPDLVVYLKTAAIGAAVAIVVGTIIEDIATAGVGLWNDWQSFVLAYKIVRYAWAL